MFIEGAAAAAAEDAIVADAMALKGLFSCSRELAAMSSPRRGTVGLCAFFFASFALELDLYVAGNWSRKYPVE